MLNDYATKILKYREKRLDNKIMKGLDYILYYCNFFIIR